MTLQSLTVARCIFYGEDDKGKIERFEDGSYSCIESMGHNSEYDADRVIEYLAKFMELFSYQCENGTLVLRYSAGIGTQAFKEFKKRLQQNLIHEKKARDLLKEVTIKTILLGSNNFEDELIVFWQSE